MSLSPVQHHVDVALGRAEAFSLFTREMSRWWPLATYSCSEGGDASVSVAEQVGGAVLETGRDGRTHLWGTITEWSPPESFAMEWHPGRPPEEATQLRVQFEPQPGGGCRVSVHHSGWEARGEAARQGYDSGWPRVLSSFATAGTELTRA